MTSRKVITIFVSGLTSALNIKNAMGATIITITKIGISSSAVKLACPCLATLCFLNRINKKQLWLLLHSEYSN